MAAHVALSSLLLWLFNMKNRKHYVAFGTQILKLSQESVTFIKVEELQSCHSCTSSSISCAAQKRLNKRLISSFGNNLGRKTPSPVMMQRGVCVCARVRACVCVWDHECQSEFVDKYAFGKCQRKKDQRG